MGARDGLKIGLRVVVLVVHDDRVGRLQVDADAAGPSREQEDGHLRAGRVECLHRRLAVGVGRVAVEPDEADARELEEALELVEHEDEAGYDGQPGSVRRRRTEDETAMAARDELGQHRLQQAHLGRGVDEARIGRLDVLDGARGERVADAEPQVGEEVGPAADVGALLALAVVEQLGDELRVALENGAVDLSMS